MKRSVDLAIETSTYFLRNSSYELVMGTSTLQVLLLHTKCLSMLGSRVSLVVKLHILRCRSLRFHIWGFGILSFRVLSYYILESRSFRSLFLHRYTMVVVVLDLGTPRQAGLSTSQMSISTVGNMSTSCLWKRGPNRQLTQQVFHIRHLPHRY